MLVRSDLYFFSFLVNVCWYVLTYVFFHFGSMYVGKNVCMYVGTNECMLVRMYVCWYESMYVGTNVCMLVRISSLDSQTRV